MERFVFAGGIAAFVAGAGGCSTLLGYDGIAFEDTDTSGTKTGIDPECIPGEAPGQLDDTCGAFVSAENGDDTLGDGSKERPFRTLARALAKSAVVYACNDGPFTEAITVEREAAIFGGLDCADGWTHMPVKRTQWRAGPGEVPLRVAELAHVQLRDMSIAAADATSPGGSSIAIVAGALSTLDAKHCAISAGRGADGQLPPVPAAVGQQGPPGSKGSDGCSASAIATDPGLGGQTMCDAQDVSGGAGGPGLEGASGADGSTGSPTPVSGDSGRGGKKQDSTLCEAGHGGAKGETGTSGAGAKGTGTLTADGFAGADGADGGPGKPGQGGGGGGGARECINGMAGPAGGGGGAGGCGGAGGKGGQAGGASIGIVSLNAKLAIADVVISTKEAGRGADGAPGGPGGKGGLAGTGGFGDQIAKACAGGKGGDGGKGGHGGGGTGGPSIGIAYRGSPPPTEGVEITVAKTASEGGKGDTAGDGAPGVCATTQEMP